MTKIKKIIAGVTALACAGVVSVGVATEGFTNWTPTVEQNAPVSNGGMVAGNLFGKGMFLSMVKASAATADTVTVTATLATAGSGYNDDLTWSPAFKTTSGWASGKTVTDYVTVTPASDTHSITVKCKQAFGTPIVITVTSVDNPDVKATCQLDYVKRIYDVDITMNDTNVMYWGQENNYEGQVTLGVGTITPTLSIGEVYVYDDNGYLQDERVAEIMNERYVQGADGVGQHQEDINEDGTFYGQFLIAPGNFYRVDLSNDQIRQLNNLLLEEELVSDLAFDFTIQATYNGTVYSDYAISDGGDWYVPVSMDGVALNAVTGVSLDKTTFIF